MRERGGTRRNLHYPFVPLRRAWHLEMALVRQPADRLIATSIAVRRGGGDSAPIMSAAPVELL